MSIGPPTEPEPVFPAGTQLPLAPRWLLTVTGDPRVGAELYPGKILDIFVRGVTDVLRVVDAERIPDDMRIEGGAGNG